MATLSLKNWTFLLHFLPGLFGEGMHVEVRFDVSVAMWGASLGWAMAAGPRRCLHTGLLLPVLLYGVTGVTLPAKVGFCSIHVAQLQWLLD